MRQGLERSADPQYLAEMADLNEGFSSSDLPFRVDIVDFASTSETFREIIRADHVSIQVV
jgi:hypothetical protein